MNKVPHMEVNIIPSALNTSAPTGVASQLAAAAENAPQYDGVTIEQMLGNPLYERGDKIDKIGRAQKAIANAAKIVGEPKRAKFIRQLNDAATRLAKPKSITKN